VSAEAPELTCQELVEIITDYLEGALPPSERERFEAHLRLCDGCDAYLAQMRTTIRIAGTLTENHVEPMAREQLLQLFRDWNRG
jgi:anti-sigma factor RsiW